MIGWGAALQLASAAGQVAVAFTLLAANGRHRPSRALAVLLLLSAGLLASAAMSLLPDSLPAGVAGGYVHGYASIALPFAAVYFVGVYPRPRPWMPKGWLGPASFVAAAAVPLAIYANDHTWFWDLSGHASDAELYGDGRVIKGPFLLFFRLVELVSGLAALVLMRDYLQDRSEQARRATLLVGLGFFVPAACTCAIIDFLFRVQEDLLLAGVPGGGFSSGLGRIYDAMLVLQMLVVAGLIILAGCAAFSRRQRAERRAALLFGGFLAATAGSGVAIFLFLEGETFLQAIYAVWGFWNLVGAGLLAYGLLKFQIFDIDLKVKVGISRTTVAALFGAMVLVGSEIIEARSNIDSLWPAVLIAAGATLVLKPLQWVGNRLADRLLPGVEDTEAYRELRGHEVYQAALEGILQDGVVTPAERRVLDGLRARLGLATEEAAALEARASGGA